MDPQTEAYIQQLIDDGGNMPTSITRTSVARNLLARRIRASRSVSLRDDPDRSYRRAANECRKGELSYNATFGIGKCKKS